jgi:lipoate-protein ligase A
MLHYVEITLETLPENLALDEALLLQAESAAALSTEAVDLSQPAGWLRVWELPQWAVVVGAGGALAHDVAVEQCRQDGVTIGRRSSGGGTVLLGPGCLLFSLILPVAADPAYAQVRSSYAAILQRLSQSLRRFDPRVVVAGISDLAIGSRKFSGNAQQRKARFLLHHGTILYAMDLTQISRYLRTPEHQPEYRAGRTHAEFVTNLPATGPALRACLRDAFGAEPLPAKQIERLLPLTLAQTRVAEQFGLESWVSRR